MAMAMASVHNSTIKIPLFQTTRLLTGQLSSNLILPPSPLSRSVLTFARRRSNAGRPVSKKTTSRGKVDVVKDGDVNEDAFEALFKQLEEDLKRDEEAENDGDDDISEEDLALLERELEEALAEDEDLSELLSLMAGDSTGGDTDDDGEKQDEINGRLEGEGEKAEEELVKLKGWQLRRLAEALKVGRRKTSIKNLSTELCIDRAIVLELLRDPPAKLLMLSAALPDKPAPTVVTAPIIEVTPSADPTEVTNDSQPEAGEETPIHVLQGSWSAQKRIKKAHASTLEAVYSRSKRPTNAMISSIIQVTNLPRKKVVKWFEDKRAADGLPQERRPFLPSSPSVTAQ